MATTGKASPAATHGAARHLRTGAAALTVCEAGDSGSAAWPSPAPACRPDSCASHLSISSR
jgi:hypothetical protein